MMQIISNEVPSQLDTRVLFVFAALEFVLRSISIRRLSLSYANSFSLFHWRVVPTSGVRCL
jgi:hypothetical protein